MNCCNLTFNKAVLNDEGKMVLKLDKKAIALTTLTALVLASMITVGTLGLLSKFPVSLPQSANIAMVSVGGVGTLCLAIYLYRRCNCPENGVTALLIDNLNRHADRKSITSYTMTYLTQMHGQFDFTRVQKQFEALTALRLKDNNGDIRIDRENANFQSGTKVETVTVDVPKGEK